jgi:threonine dehydrogenase-like Zn-dependent dehydrogenase
MGAVVCHGPQDYRFEELAVPAPSSGEVLVRVLSVGICASDLKCYQGAPFFWGDDRREGYCQPPVTPGHEFVGEVVALGENAEEQYGLSVGDLAVSEQIVPCWSCRYCTRGQYWMCQQHDIYGFRKRTFGAMAEFMIYPAGALNHQVPRSVPPHHAAFVEPLACAIHATQRGNIELDDHVVVAGCGPIGLGIVATARRKNPSMLIALDMSDDRLDLARACGADITLNPSSTDVVGEIRELTDGYGCDVYIEATGHPDAVAQGLHMLRKLGTFVEFSVMRDPVTVDWTIIGDTKELNIHGAHLGAYSYPIAIDMIADNVLPMERIVTHQLPLTEFQEGLDLVKAGTKSVKVTLNPQSS